MKQQKNRRNKIIRLPLNIQPEPITKKEPLESLHTKENLDTTPKKQTYNYNFSSKEDPE